MFNCDFDLINDDQHGVENAHIYIFFLFYNNKKLKQL